MAEKQNKSIIVGAVVAVIVIVAVIVGFVLAKGNGGDAIENGEGGQTGGTGQTEKSNKGAGFSHIDVVVGYGDYDTMLTQSKAIQNGEMVGKVIQIDGIVSHPMSNYSIGQEDEKGSFVGTVFVIEGAEEDEYPEDGDHVVVTGEVIEKSPMYFVIRTTPQNVTVLEEADEVEPDEIEEYWGETDDIDVDE